MLWSLPSTVVFAGVYKSRLATRLSRMLYTDFRERSFLGTWVNSVLLATSQEHKQEVSEPYPKQENE